MIICATALLYYVLSSQGVHWTDIADAWFIAAAIDASLVAYFIYMKYGD